MLQLFAARGVPRNDERPWREKESRSFMMPLRAEIREQETPEFNEILFSSAVVQVGRFWAPADHPNFGQSGLPARDYFVFPLSSSRLQRAGEDPYVADPTVVGFHNRNELYYRSKLDERGDRTHSFSLSPEALRDVLRHYDPAAAAREDRPFRRSHAPTDARTYLRQHELIRRVRRSLVGPLTVEEEVFGILARVMDGVLRAAGQQLPADCPSRRGLQRERQRVESARCYLALHFREGVTVRQLADDAGVSPFSLIRMFRRHTGTTIHAYLNQLRLRSALEMILDTAIDLTDLALDLGYSSHSHFTAAFRKTFGTTPSALRERRGGRAAQRRALQRIPLETMNMRPERKP
jgi:AraC-like DNA-binding protein